MSCKIPCLPRRRKTLSISSPMNPVHEKPRLVYAPPPGPPSIDVPRGHPQHLKRSHLPRRPNPQTSVPSNTQSAYTAYSSSSSEILTDEKFHISPSSSSSSEEEGTRMPCVFDYDATPRIYKLFNFLSPPSTKLTFTEAILPPPPPPPPQKKSFASRVSKRFSRRFSLYSNNRSYTSIPAPTPPPPVPELPQSVRKQRLVTRLPGGGFKEVTMVPSLRLAVPKGRFGGSVGEEATPIETSPICDPWGEGRERMEGMSSRQQAWML